MIVEKMEKMIKVVKDKNIGYMIVGKPEETMVIVDIMGSLEELVNETKNLQRINTSQQDSINQMLAEASEGKFPLKVWPKVPIEEEMEVLLESLSDKACRGEISCDIKHEILNKVPKLIEETKKLRAWNGKTERTRAIEEKQKRIDELLGEIRSLNEENDAKIDKELDNARQKAFGGI